VEQRLAWIRSEYQGDNPAGFAAQPYEQLAAVYRRAGQDGQARKVAIARRADLRTYGNLNRYRKAGNWLLDKTIKYGYQSWRAGVGLAALFVIFTVLSCFAQQHHLIVPVGNFKGAAPSATNCTSTYPCFYPAGYSVDTVIPIINVHQADNWGLDGAAPWGQALVTANVSAETPCEFLLKVSPRKRRGCGRQHHDYPDRRSVRGRSGRSATSLFSDPNSGQTPSPLQAAACGQFRSRSTHNFGTPIA